MQVFFYLPDKYLPDAARQEAWKSGTLTTLEESGKIACAQCWIYQTWLALENAGCHTALVHEMPREGIVITLSGLLGPSYRANPGVFCADIVADYVPHPGAHLHIVQNAVHARRLARSTFMPLWPHPNLLPRDPARGDRFENLGFFGDACNLAPELRDPAWQASLREKTGLEFRIVGAQGWHDYREMDCILAVRGLNASTYLHKPSTKLYNAWIAGVPFIGGMDSAYRGDGKPGTDYLAVARLAELETALARLAEDAALRKSLVEAGRARSAFFNPDAILSRWKTLVESTLPGAAEKWQRRPSVSKAVFWKTQAALAWVDRKVR